MIKIILTLSTIAGLLAFVSCTTVKEPQASTHSTSTTTESTSLQQPAPATTETETVRSY